MNRICKELFWSKNFVFEIQSKTHNFTKIFQTVGYFIPCCPEITTPLLVGDIFFKIDERSMILLWKGVKCFCCDVPKRFRTLPADFGHPRPIFNFFVISKKALFRWYTFGLRISIFESCEFYHYFGHVFYLQWKIYFRYFK